VTSQHPSLAGLHVAFLSWRDTGNPEGGGAERYLEQVAAGVVERGGRATVFSAHYPGAADVEERDGIRYVHRGSKMSVYLEGMRALRSGDLGPVDVVVDVQNGLPFFSRLVTRKPVVVLVHHVHREQWPIVYPGMTGRVGWWVERWLAPRLYRRSQYVVVSRATLDEIRSLGVTGPRVAVVHNGTELVPPSGRPKTTHPSICVVGRLVPHKQVEHAIDAALRLREELPGLQLTVVGSGWWEEDLRRYAAERAAGDTVVFTGHVDEARKREVYEESWVMALPSLKEGWGLVVGEAGMADTPTVAFRSAGGTRESIVHGHSGLLADDDEEFVAQLRTVLVDADLRAALSRGAHEVSGRFSWQRARASFAHVLHKVHLGDRVAAQDEVEDEIASGQPAPPATTCRS
jgi:glycosyltransferase involved in cell wall biosynthesis